MRERDLQDMMEQAAGYLGWRCFHDRDSRRNNPGFPDLVCIRDGKLLVLELKTEKGRVRPEQVEWLDDFAQVPGVVARIVRPADVDDVLAILQEAS